MTLYETGANALGHSQTEQVPLTHTAQRLYSALSSAALVVRDHRGYHPGVTVVTFFAPLEAVALAIGVSRQTVYNRLPELVKAGLVDQRGHYCTHRGQTRADGSLWAVRLNPDESATPVKVEHDWLKAHYRDLGADIAAGRTAWAAMQESALQSNLRETDTVDIKTILLYAITPSQKTTNNDCKAEQRLELESLMDVPHAPQEAVNEAVDLAAKAIAGTLGAGGASLNFYRWLVWALLRLERAGRGSYWYQIYLMVQRAGVDHREGACQNAGGLFVSRLKTSVIWDDLRSVPMVRVGMKPT